MTIENLVQLKANVVLTPVAVNEKFAAMRQHPKRPKVIKPRDIDLRGERLIKETSPRNNQANLHDSLFFILYCCFSCKCLDYVCCDYYHVRRTFGYPKRTRPR